MNEPMIFNDSLFGRTRTIVINGEIWFVAQDVLDALGYERNYRPSRALHIVPSEWKGVQPMHIRSENGSEQLRSMLCLSEQGLYFFLGRSDKTRALPYQKKVAGEIIPAIRKTGMFTTKQLTMEDLCREYLATCEKQRQLEADINKITTEKQQALAQRDEIGNNFGAGPDYYKVSEIPWLHDIFRPNHQKRLHPAIGHLLARISNEHGYEIKKCQHENGGHWWRAYSSYAVDILHKQLLANHHMLAWLRKSKRRS